MRRAIVRRRKGPRRRHGHHRGRLENRPVLPRRFCLELRPQVADRVHGGKTGSRQAPDFVPNCCPLVSESCHVERRRVDRRGQTGRGSFQAVQHLIDGGKLCVLIQQALRLERIRHFRDQLPAYAAKVRHSREDPDGRRAKGDDAKHFDRVARSPPGEEIIRQRLPVVVNTFYASDLLDQVPERGVHDVLIQLALADPIRKRDLSHFARHSGAEPQDGSSQSLGDPNKYVLTVIARVLRRQATLRGCPFAM